MLQCAKAHCSKSDRFTRHGRIRRMTVLPGPVRKACQQGAGGKKLQHPTASLSPSLALRPPCRAQIDEEVKHASRILQFLSRCCCCRSDPDREVESRRRSVVQR